MRKLCNRVKSRVLQSISLTRKCENITHTSCDESLSTAITLKVERFLLSAIVSACQLKLFLHQDFT